MKPFLKWAGGKYRLVQRIKAIIPPSKRLLEPFAGSCALSLNTDFKDYWLNDLNQDLITLYQTLQKEGRPFIDFCKSFFIPANNQPEQYYLLRERFNRETDPSVKSALFVYLNRHGYNGLSRYNRRGEFNVPFGKYRQPYFPETEMLFFHEKLRHAVFTCLDFEEIFQAAVAGDLLYCDPPYLPLNETALFTSYTGAGFGKEEQIRLANAATQAARRGIKTIISNHYHPFTTMIYQAAHLEIFPVQRFISCDGKNRGKVAEVLAVFG